MGSDRRRAKGEKLRGTKGKREKRGDTKGEGRKQKGGERKWEVERKRLNVKCARRAERKREKENRSPSREMNNVKLMSEEGKRGRRVEWRRRSFFCEKKQIGKGRARRERKV